MQQSKKDFIRFMLSANVLKFGEFKTKSGRLSPYFVNTGSYCTGAQLLTLGKYYASLINEKTNGKFDAMFGPAYKGIPLVCAADAAYFELFNIDKPYLFNRKEQKDHGEGGSFVGYQPKDKDNIIIIEDVITAGTAVRESLPLLQSAADVIVTDMFISVNRMEKGYEGKIATQEIKEEFGISVHSIVNVVDIYEYLKNEFENGKALSEKMEQYMTEYCIL